MIISEDKSEGVYQIKAYTPGQVTVNDTVYTSSLVVSPDKLLAPWRPKNLADVNDDDLVKILPFEPEVVLLGTGLQFQMPVTSVLGALYAHNIGVECMDTGAACRTFMALSAEGRRVVAALLIE